MVQRQQRADWRFRPIGVRHGTEGQRFESFRARSPVTLRDAATSSRSAHGSHLTTRGLRPSETPATPCGLVNPPRGQLGSASTRLGRPRWPDYLRRPRRPPRALAFSRSACSQARRVVSPLRLDVEPRLSYKLPARLGPVWAHERPRSQRRNDALAHLCLVLGRAREQDSQPHNVVVLERGVMRRQRTGTLMLPRAAQSNRDRAAERTWVAAGFEPYLRAVRVRRAHPSTVTEASESGQGAAACASSAATSADIRRRAAPRRRSVGLPRMPARVTVPPLRCFDLSLRRRH